MFRFGGLRSVISALAALSCLAALASESIVPMTAKTARAEAIVSRAVGQEVPASWRPLGGPPGRIAHVVAASRTELYAVTVSGSNRRDDETPWRNLGYGRRGDALYRSTDAGTTWQPLTNDLPPGPVSTLYWDEPTNALYVGLQAGGDIFSRRYGLWRSVDRGLHWEEVPLGRSDLLIRRMARGAGGRDLWLGAIDAGKYPSSYVYRSTDGGRTWQGVRALQYSHVLVDLIPHPGDPDRLFIPTYGEVWLSEDAGATWHLPGNPETPPASRYTGPVRLAVSPDAPDTLLAAFGYSRQGPEILAFERSTDAGATWTPVAATGLPSKVGARGLMALAGGGYLLAADTGAYRSRDGVSWQRLEGALSAGTVAQFAVWPGVARAVLAATGHGLFVSYDDGALWQLLGTTLPANSGVLGLLTDGRRPDRLLAIGNPAPSWDLKPPLLMRKTGNAAWMPAAAGLPDVEPLTWALDPTDPDTVYLASWEHFFRSSDGGLSWQTISLPFGRHAALALSPAAPGVLYLAGRPALRSTDRGQTWTEMPIRIAGQEQQTGNVLALVADPADPNRLWAAPESGGVWASTDGGRSWTEHGLSGAQVSWLVAAPGDPRWLYAGVPEGGIYRWSQADGTWRPASAGLPAGSTILAFLADPRTPGLLWAARNGGGLYRSRDGGETWTNVAVGLGDNLVLSLATDPAMPGGVLLGTATAGIWTLQADVQPSAPPRSVDARIEIVWPHGFAAVTEAKLANIGLRLFNPRSLLPTACTWTPKVTVWQALNNAPAAPLAEAMQHTVDGQPFPFWSLNDVDVSAANQPENRLYFLVRVAGVETATSVWAHGADPRTYYPEPDVPSGTATGRLDALDARIQVVWPHDAAGTPRAVAEAEFVNVSVALFKHGTRLSVPVGWQEARPILYGAWNHEVGRPLATEAEIVVRQAGAITYPTWEFNNVPVARAADPTNKLYLWAMADRIETYPTIWAHGADPRTFFPAKDEPVMGCVP